MKGKLQKIGLGMSGLMCAGMLFTCVLPAKAVPCQHMTYQYLDWGEEYIDGFDDYAHYYRRDETGYCGICGETFVLNTLLLRKEAHQIKKLSNETDLTYEWCTKCEYNRIYYVAK